MNLSRNHRAAFLLLFLLLSVACHPLATAQPTAAGVLAAPTPTAYVSCVLPDLSGLDQQTAANSLAALGLIPVKQAEFSDTVPVGMVISTELPAGTTLTSCQGEVKFTISLGPKPVPSSTPTTVPPLPTATRMPNPTPTLSIPDFLDQPMYHTLYSESFDTPNHGFNPAWQVTYGANGASKTDAGRLVLTGLVTALTRELSWQDYIVTLKQVSGHQYYFTVFLRMQDLKNGYVMSCRDIASSGSDASLLHCEWYRLDDGQRVEIPGMVVSDVCVGACDIVVEAKGADFRFLFNGQEKYSFTDEKYSAGLVGFTANSPSAPLSLVSFDVSSPDHPASPGEILFRDDFKTDSWWTGTEDDSYATNKQSLANGGYRWDVTARQPVALKQCLTAVTLPDIFTLTAVFHPLTGPKDMSYALVFNCQDSDNLYFFRVNAGGSFGLFKLQHGNWTTLIDNTPIAWNTSDTYSLQVIGGKGQYLLLLDGKLLANVKDDSFTHGGVGVGLELFHAGDRALMEVDQVMVDMP
jgi:hypothetical protein